MSEPSGPTGVITLKQISNLAYEQYGKILMNATGTTQIFITAQDFTDLFERQSMETQMVWLGGFQSRLQGTPNTNQSSFFNGDIAGWSGGAWSATRNTDGSSSIKNSATLSGAVSLELTTITTALPEGNLLRDETANLQQIISHVSRNPTFFLRFAQGAGGSTQNSIGWHRGSEGFTNPALLLGGIYVRWTTDGNLFAVCVTRTGSTQLETSADTGVAMVTGVYHTVRMIVTGGGTAVEFVVDGVSRATITTNIPTEGGTFALAPGFGATNANLGQTMLVDYMAMSQQRTP